MTADGSASDIPGTVSDATGAFAVSKVTPGNWKLVIDKEHYETLNTAVDMGEADKTLGAEDCTMIPKKYPIQGCVTSKITKAPLPGAVVKLLAGGPKAGLYTGSSIPSYHSSSHPPTHSSSYSRHKPPLFSF